MPQDKPFSVDFDALDDFLSDLVKKYEDDETAKSILDKANFSPSQLKVIRLIVIAALQAYDLQKQQ